MESAASRAPENCCDSAGQRAAGVAPRRRAATSRRQRTAALIRRRRCIWNAMKDIEENLEIKEIAIVQTITGICAGPQAINTMLGVMRMLMLHS